MMRSTSSPRIGSSVAKLYSLRLMRPVTLKPTVYLLDMGSGPAALNLTWSVRGLVTPWKVKAPGTSAVPGAVGFTDWALNVLVGYLAGSIHIGSRSSPSRTELVVETVSTGTEMSNLLAATALGS